MTYNAFGGMLNLARCSTTHQRCCSVCWCVSVTTGVILSLVITVIVVLVTTARMLASYCLEKNQRYVPNTRVQTFVKVKIKVNVDLYTVLS